MYMYLSTLTYTCTYAHTNAHICTHNSHRQTPTTAATAATATTPKTMMKWRMMVIPMTRMRLQHTVQHTLFLYQDMGVWQCKYTLYHTLQHTQPSRALTHRVTAQMQIWKPLINWDYKRISSWAVCWRLLQSAAECCSANEGLDDPGNLVQPIAFGVSLRFQISSSMFLLPFQWIQIQENEKWDWDRLILIFDFPYSSRCSWRA